MEIIAIINSTLAILGIFICYKIYCKKSQPGPMVCPLGADCKKVLTSDFATFLGIKLEVAGAVYYSLLLLGYASYIVFWPTCLQLQSGLLLLSAIGCLFSLYLIAVQAFFIKSWCTWCLFSALTTIAIFVTGLLGFLHHFFDLFNIASMLKTPFVMLHLLGFALGVGGATIADIFFMRFLKDFKISEEENKILTLMSNVIWLGLGILIISGIGLYLGNMEFLNQSTKFLTKVIVVGVILINGIVLNIVVAPRLVSMRFKNEKEMQNTLPVMRSLRLRRLAFACGAISFTSWYTAAILGSLRSIPLSFPTILSIYIGIVILAVIGSQIFERVFCAYKTSS